MFTKENLIQALTIYQQKIEAQKAYLSELDTPIGDGDHGNNMSRGMNAVLQSMTDKDPQTLADVFKVTAMALISKVGGASGPLYGTAMMEMAKAAGTSDDAATLLEAGLEGIEKRGNSQPGEKTMIDVWAPALTALKETKLTKAALTNFAEQTKEIYATKGRASYVGERSLGHIDPGAMSSCYLFEAFIEAGVFS
jgi:dihydroxyacetone kinase-like protein